MPKEIDHQASASRNVETIKEGHFASLQPQVLEDLDLKILDIQIGRPEGNAHNGRVASASIKRRKKRQAQVTVNTRQQSGANTRHPSGANTRKHSACQERQPSGKTKAKDVVHMKEEPIVEVDPGAQGSWLIYEEDEPNNPFSRRGTRLPATLAGQEVRGRRLEVGYDSMNGVQMPSSLENGPYRPQLAQHQQQQHQFQVQSFVGPGEHVHGPVQHSNNMFPNPAFELSRNVPQAGAPQMQTSIGRNTRNKPGQARKAKRKTMDGPRDRPRKASKEPEANVCHYQTQIVQPVNV